jgi:hypothetical protein
MQDHSALEQKIMLRHRALGGMRPRHVVDFYAGEGVIAGMLWLAVAARVTCVEKDRGKAAKIDPCATVVVGDNRRHLHLAADADVIDCDAYGMVAPFVRQLASVAAPGALVIFTDGSPSAKGLRQASSLSVRALQECLHGLHMEPSASGTAIYGYGWVR